MKRSARRPPPSRAKSDRAAASGQVVSALMCRVRALAGIIEPRILVVAVACVPRVWAAFADQGVYFADEIYQSLEQGHRLAFGYGLIPWEFELGARSWLFPGMLGGFLAGLSGLGFESARGLIVATKILMAAISVLSVWVSMSFAEELGGRRAALLAGVFVAFFPLSLVTASRCLSEVPSATLLLAAGWLSFRAGRTPALISGALAASSIFFRYQNGLVALTLLVLIAFARRWRDVAWYLAAAVPIFIAGGLLDLWTWGAPFHALIVYLDFNLVQGRAELFGVEPFYYYFQAAWTATGPFLLAIVGGLFFVPRRALPLLLVPAIYILAHSFVPHKELRFILPIVPFLATLGAVGLAARLEHSRRNGIAGFALVLGAALLMSFQAARLSFADLGMTGYVGPRNAHFSAWFFSEDVNRLLWTAGERDDLCGLIVERNPVAVGGYSYLHRDVPMFFAAKPAIERLAPGANYLIAPLSQGPELAALGFLEVEKKPPSALYRRPGSCATPPPDYDRKLSPWSRE